MNAIFCSSNESNQTDWRRTALVVQLIERNRWKWWGRLMWEGNGEEKEQENARKRWKCASVLNRKRRRRRRRFAFSSSSLLLNYVLSHTGVRLVAGDLNNNNKRRYASPVLKLILILMLPKNAARGALNVQGRSMSWARHTTVSPLASEVEEPVRERCAFIFNFHFIAEDLKRTTSHNRLCRQSVSQSVEIIPLYLPLLRIIL